MKSLKLILTFLFAFQITSYAQLDTVVNLLSKHTTVYSIKKAEDFIIKSRDPEEDSFRLAQYKRSTHYLYHLVDSLASDNELIRLLHHKSQVVQSYAAIALSFRDTLVLPGLLQKMLDDTQFVATAHGCVVFDETVASNLYYGIFRRNRETGFPTQVFIDRMDSIYLSHKNAPSGNISLKFCNLRAKSLNPIIEKLAFEKHEFSAINYLFNWYKADYYQPLNALCADLLDSNITYYGYPVTKSLLTMLIDLKDKKTLQRVSGWLKHNREKWVAIRGIDNLLDKNIDFWDSIGTNSERYPFEANEANFLIGRWAIMSGMNISDLKNSDTIILEKTTPYNTDWQGLGFEVETDGLYSHYYEHSNDDERKLKMAGTPVFDSKNLRICVESSRDWDWYKIIKEKDRLILIREYRPYSLY